MATDSEKLILSISADVTQVKRALAKLSGDTKTETDKMKASFGGLDKAAKYTAANMNQAGTQMTASVKQTRAAVVNLTAQMNDITQQFVAGTSPLTIMAQQGSQVTQALQAAGGGVTGLARTVGGALMGMLSPMNLVAMALIGLTGVAVNYFTATKDNSKEAEEILKQHAETIAALKEAYGKAAEGIEEYTAKSQELAIGLAKIDASILKLQQKRATTAFFEDAGMFEKLKGMVGAGDGAFKLSSLLEVDEGGITQKMRQLQEIIQGEASKSLQGLPFDQTAIDAAATELKVLESIPGQIAGGFAKLTGEMAIFQPALDEAAQSAEDGTLDFVKLQDSIARIALGDVTDEQRAFAAELVKGTEAGAKNQRALEAINKAQNQLLITWPEMIDLLKKVGVAMSGAFGEGIIAAVEMLIQRLGGVNSAISDVARGLGVLGDMAGSMVGDIVATTSDVTEFIKAREGFRSEAYWDVNAWRVGFGSDTFVNEAGKVQKVVESTVVTLQQANADLARRVGEFAGGVRATLGADLWESLDEGQKTALTSIAYNYGSLPARIVTAIKSGDRGTVARAIADLGTDNNGVNMARRKTEAQLYAKGGGMGDPLAVQETITSQQESNALEQKKLEILGGQNIEYDKKLAKQEADLKFAELEAEARKQALAEGRGLNQVEIEALRAQADAYGLLEAQQKAMTDAEKAGEKQGTAIEKLNAMLDGTKEEIALKQKILEINAQLNLSEDERALAILKVTEESARLATVEKLITQAREAGIPITAALRAEYEAMAAQLVDLALKNKELEFVQRDNDKATEERKKQLESFSDAIGGMAKTAISGFVNDLRNGVEAGEAFANMLDRVVDSLLNMALETLFSKDVLGSLFSGLSGIGGGGGLFPAAPGGMGGGLFKAGGTVGMASHSDGRSFGAGTWAGAPRFATGGVVGLRPGEVPIIAHKGEMIIPAGQTGKGGSTVDNSVHQQNTMSIDMSQTGAVAANSEDAKLFGLKIQKMVQLEMVRESRPGGLLRQGRGIS